MLASGKLTLTSKKPQEQCLKVVSRKPVKDCYCNFEANKTHARASRIQHKPASPRCHRQSKLELRTVGEIGDKEPLTSPISCETLRRVQKIDYAPRSQFLRNVQNKIYKLQTADQEDCLRICPRSSSYHRFMTSARMQDTVSDKRTALPDECKCVGRQKSPTSPTTPANSLASEQNGCNDVTCSSSKRTQVSSRKLSKSTLRKTIKSRRQIPESSERSMSKSPTRGKRITQLHKQDCCYRSELERKSVKLDSDKHAHRRDLSEDRREQCSRYDDSPIVEDSVDQQVENLRKFREQNYFETHGSSQTLTSSRSGSLQQYLLNERLFPEPVGKIHRQDLVTMPPCATTQKKRVHYFPRYVVRQEKGACNTNYRRKRCQSCPLTGHAIDLGILKARPPLNSLALKYQKKTF